ncbi:MAG: helix-turn-helix domain-containing protein [Thermotogota bacterium]
MSNLLDLLTAPQLAKLLSVDLKTLHNWVNRGEIKFFRTPGRHLRFRRADAVEFMTRVGLPVPNELAPEAAETLDEAFLRGAQEAFFWQRWEQMGFRLELSDAARIEGEQAYMRWLNKRSAEKAV